MKHYTYILLGKDGRFYYGSRSCIGDPYLDCYLGSFSDKTFQPVRKRVLSIYASREEAIEEEMRIHFLKNVDSNPRYANKSKQTSIKFFFSASGERNPNFGGGHLTSEKVQKISESTRNRLLSNPDKNPFCKTGSESMSFGRKWFTNLDRTSEIYLKPGEEPPENWIPGRKTRPARSEESRNRTRQALKGKSKSEEHKKKLSKSLKDFYATRSI